MLPNTQWRHLRASRALPILLLLLLSACGSDYANSLLGTWKDVTQERYLTIEKGSESNARMNAIIYAPSTAAEGDDSNVVMNHLSMPASMQNGVLMLEVEAGQIPVLYDSVNEVVVLNGTDKYQRVPEDIAQLKLNPERATTH